MYIIYILYIYIFYIYIYILLYCLQEKPTQFDLRVWIKTFFSPANNAKTIGKIDKCF